MANLFAFTYEEKKQMASQTAEILEEEIGLKGDAIQAVYLIPEVEEEMSWFCVQSFPIEDQFSPKDFREILRDVSCR